MYQLDTGKILIAKSNGEPIYIYPKMANRHGLIAGATGTGKTVTLKVMAESFSDAGVPVFLADAKGDLAGMMNVGMMNENVENRVKAMNLEEDGFKLKGYPTVFWDVYGERGLPLRATISEMGPLLLSRILDLNDTQTDVLTVVFKIADDENLLLIDTKDLRSMLTYVGEHAQEYSLQYGNIAKQSLSAIIRSVIALEGEGGDQFFGEPAIDIHDWFTSELDGRGKIHILACEKLMQSPKMYATFMLWLISELFETLPEAGDLEKPRMVFFFDEAHMLFDDASKNVLQKVEQVVKLIRSKGVGIYFVTQNPNDIPDGVLSQLSNKVQHALRAYTPAELRKAKAAASAFRENPDFDTFDALVNLGTGEALVSVLDEKGIPTVVQRAFILPPQSQMGAIDDVTREIAIRNSSLNLKYMEAIDRDSAYEFLQRMRFEAEAEEARQAEEAAAAKQAAIEEKERKRQEEAAAKQAAREEAAAQRQAEREAAAEAKAKEREEAAKKRKVTSAVASVGNTAAGTVGREVGNALGSTIGGKFGKKLGGNVGAALGRGLFSTLFKR